MPILNLAPLPLIFMLSHINLQPTISTYLLPLVFMVAYVSQYETTKTVYKNTKCYGLPTAEALPRPPAAWWKRLDPKRLPWAWGHQSREETQRLVGSLKGHIYIYIHANRYINKQVEKKHVYKPIDIETYVCMYVRTYVCMHVCMYVCMHVCMHVERHIHIHIFVCMSYIYIFIYIHLVSMNLFYIYIYIQI